MPPTIKFCGCPSHFHYTEFESFMLIACGKGTTLKKTKTAFGLLPKSFYSAALRTAL